MWKSKTFSNFEWCGGWNNGVVGSWTTWFLDFNKRGAWNKRGGAKFGPFLINVVAEITELCMENSQKINCCDVTSIQEGRVSFSKPADKYILIGFNKYIRLICRFTLECMTFQWTLGVSPWSANPTKLSNTLKQFLGFCKVSTICEVDP